MHSWPAIQLLGVGVGQSEREGLAEGGGRGSSSLSLAESRLEQIIETKLKFSQFLDEVTQRVLSPASLQAFSRETPPASPTSTTATSVLSLPQPGISHSTHPDQKGPEGSVSLGQVQQQATQPGKTMQDELPGSQDPTAVGKGKAYLETDIDCVRRQDEMKERKVKMENAALPQKEERGRAVTPVPECHLNSLERMSSPGPVLNWDEGFFKYPCRSVSLPRGINMVLLLTLQ